MGWFNFTEFIHSIWINTFFYTRMKDNKQFFNNFFTRRFLDINCLLARFQIIFQNNHGVNTYSVKE